MRRAAVHVRFEDKAERPKANDGETIGSKITALDDQSKSENSYAAVPTQMTNAVRETSLEDSAADSTTNESRKRNIRSDDSEAAEGLPKSEGESKKDRKKKKRLLRQKKALENA